MLAQKVLLPGQRLENQPVLSNLHRSGLKRNMKNTNALKCLEVFERKTSRRELDNPTSSRKDAISAKSMNSPNPFVPQGSLLEQQSKRRSRVKVAVFCVLAINVVGLMALLMQGCKREQTEAENQPTIDTNETAMMNTNPPPVEASNPPVAAAGRMTARGAGNRGSEYVVVKGDSLWKIAKKNSVTVKAIEAANPGIDPARLEVGQKLALPGATSAGGSATDMTGSSSTGGGDEIYIVKSGIRCRRSPSATAPPSRRLNLRTACPRLISRSARN